MKDQKYIYRFSKENTDGGKGLVNTLGGKGANLAEMCSLNIPVPPGFTISTEICNYFLEHNCFPNNFEDSLFSYIKEIELFLDYDKDLPGLKVENWLELTDALKDILINNNDKYKNKRNDMINSIYPNLDGKARERIANFITSSLETKKEYVYDRL